MPVDTKAEDTIETKPEIDEEPDRAALWAAYDQEDGGAEDAPANPEEHDPQDGNQGKDPDAGEDEGREAVEEGGGDTGEDGEDGEEGATDIWADAPDPLRSAWQTQADELRRIQHAHDSDRGRIRSYQAQIARLQGELASRPQGPATSPAASQSGPNGQQAAAKAAILKGDDWEAMREEYPDLAGVIENAFNQFDERLEGVRGQVSTVMSDRQTAYAQQMSQELERRIPGAYDLVMGNSEQLRSWLGEQPRPIREAFQRNAQTITDVDEAAFVLGHFRDYIHGQQTENAGASPNGSTDGSEAQTSMSTRRQRQIRAAGAAGVSRGARGQMTESAPEGREQAWDYWDKRGL